MISYNFTYQPNIHYNVNISMKIMYIATLLLLLPFTSPFMEFELQRNPHSTKKLELIKSQCQDPSMITQQSKYIELCYEKDIAYVFQFTHASQISYLALDLTSPISWLKDEKCKLLQTNKSCTYVKQSFNEKIKGMMKQKINDIVSKLKNKIADDDSKAIIQGSNEIVMGDVTTIKNLSIIAKNHEHLNKIVDVVLLGLYFIGEHDNMTLNSTNFISAHKITPNLNTICDGAVSLRFDDNSQKSFLNEVFEYMQTKEKIISVYLSKDKNIVTIGGISTRCIQHGLSSMSRIKMEEDEKYGKLPRMQGLVFENQNELNNIEADSLIIFTLSASYIAFPQQTITLMFTKFFPSTLKCKINNESYIECLNNNKQDIKSLMSTSLDLDMDTSMIHFLLKDLIIKNQANKLIFNIKQTVNNYTVIGEPFFLNYYVYFDYGKNEIGYALRKLTIEEHIITAVTLVHFIMVSLLLGTCFILTSDSCKRLYYHAYLKISQRTQDSIKQTFKRYQPVFDEQQDKERQKEIPQLEDVEGI